MDPLLTLASPSSPSPPSPPISNVPPSALYVPLPLYPVPIVSPKARLAGLCQALGYPRYPEYEVIAGDKTGFVCSVCIFPPPEPQTELRLHCPVVCNSKRDAEVEAARQAMHILLRTQGDTVGAEPIGGGLL